MAFAVHSKIFCAEKFELLKVVQQKYTKLKHGLISGWSFFEHSAQGDQVTVILVGISISMYVFQICVVPLVIYRQKFSELVCMTMSRAMDSRWICECSKNKFRGLVV